MAEVIFLRFAVAALSLALAWSLFWIQSYSTTVDLKVAVRDSQPVNPFSPRNGSEPTFSAKASADVADSSVKSGAFVWFASWSKSNDYWLTVAASIQCMSSHNSTYERIVITDGLITANIRRVFEGVGAQVIAKEDLPNVETDSFDRLERLNSPLPPNWYKAFNKFLAWTMIEYDRIVVLDGDTIAWQNVDELLQYPELSAVTDLTQPFLKTSTPHLFNSGVLVIQPSLQTFSDLLDVFAPVPVRALDPHFKSKGAVTEQRSSVNPKLLLSPSQMEEHMFLAEMGALNWFFKDQWKPLPIVYNVFTAFLKSGSSDLSLDWKIDWGTIKIAHHVVRGKLKTTTTSCDNHECIVCCLKNLHCLNKAKSFFVPVTKTQSSHHETASPSPPTKTNDVPSIEPLNLEEDLKVAVQN